MKIPGVLGLIVLFLVSACETPLRAADVSAVVDNPTSASRSELMQVVAIMLNGAPVTLADDALVSSNLLVIERKQQRNIQGRIDGGRLMGPVEHFELVLNNNQCLLVHIGTQKRVRLKEANCKPFNDREP